VAYVWPNFKCKKDLVRAVKQGDQIEVFRPGLGSVPIDGGVFLEGLHSPQSHTWYAQAVLKEGKIIAVK